MSEEHKAALFEQALGEWVSALLNKCAVPDRYHTHTTKHTSRHTRQTVQQRRVADCNSITVILFKEQLPHLVQFTQQQLAWKQTVTTAAAAAAEEMSLSLSTIFRLASQRALLSWAWLICAHWFACCLYRLGSLIQWWWWWSPVMLMMIIILIIISSSRRVVILLSLSLLNGKTSSEESSAAVTAQSHHHKRMQITAVWLTVCVLPESWHCERAGDWITRAN